ncbi:MAG TPA: hypothetical protein VIR81_04745 [Myxococcales bacterium]|nr:hypothetical protein [Myxococcales bacterium]
MEMVLFVPGFFGFGAFGHPDRPLVEYFAHVEDALLRGHLRALRFAVHQPPPASSLAARVLSLHAKASELIAAGASRLHLIGHSTGGLDARLLAHPRYTGLPERNELIARIGSLITISAPFRGTPLARRVGRGAWLAAPALWFASILASRHRLRLAGQMGTLFNVVKRAALRQEPTPTDELIAQLADVDEDTAHQIRRFLGDVAGDHRLIHDITPEAMEELNRTLEGEEPVPPQSFVSVAPHAGFSPMAFVRSPLQRLLFDLTWTLTAEPMPEAPIPDGPWIGGARIGLTPTSNDGIVPAWSQTLDGQAAGLVLGDHLDVIGHSQAAGATFMRSGSSFDEERFRALWRAVARKLRDGKPGVSSRA